MKNLLIIVLLIFTHSVHAEIINIKVSGIIDGLQPNGNLGSIQLPTGFVVGQSYDLLYSYESNTIGSPTDTTAYFYNAAVTKAVFRIGGVEFDALPDSFGNSSNIQISNNNPTGIGAYLDAYQMHTINGGSPGPWYSVGLKMYAHTSSPLQVIDSTNLLPPPNAGSMLNAVGASIAYEGVYFMAGADNGAVGGSLAFGNVQSVSVVPVPATAWLLGSGLLGLIGVVRRKAT